MVSVLFRLCKHSISRSSTRLVYHSRLLLRPSIACFRSSPRGTLISVNITISWYYGRAYPASASDAIILLQLHGIHTLVAVTCSCVVGVMSAATQCLSKFIESSSFESSSFVMIFSRVLQFRINWSVSLFFLPFTPWRLPYTKVL